MFKTFKDGDYLVVNRLAYSLSLDVLAFHYHIFNFSSPQRADVINFLNPYKKDNISYIKRVIAVPGDSFFIKNDLIYIHFKEGNNYIKSHYKDKEKITVDGNIFVKNPFDRFATFLGVNDFSIKSIPLYTLKKNEFLLVGDNRNQSYDGRWIGPVGLENILGEVVYPNPKP